MELTGKLEATEEKLLIENDLTDIGWKVENFKIISNNFTEAQDNTYVARLAMRRNLDPNFASFERNDVLGIATYGGGGNQQILDMVTLIVDELIITNCTQTGSISDKSICYQIILGQYSISDTEQVIAQVKKSQSD